LQSLSPAQIAGTSEQRPVASEFDGPGC